MPNTREEWLQRAVDGLWPLIEVHTVRHGGKRVPTQVSVGWPFGSPRKRIGECFATKAAKDGRAHLFVSPLVYDPVHVLDVLLHEMIHAWDDCKSGHSGPFRTMAKAVGLTGRMTATTPDETLAPVLAKLAEELGEYPHQGLQPTERKKQSTRMLKASCSVQDDDYVDCGYTVRLTRKWADVGLPACPVHDWTLELDES